MAIANSLPKDASGILDWTWVEYKPYFDALEAQELTQSSVAGFLADWSQLSDVLSEASQRMAVATTVNTQDAEATARYTTFLDETFPRATESAQRLKEKLLASGLEPSGFEIPLKKMRAEADLFREVNVGLLAGEQKLCLEYQEITGAQTINWRGTEMPLPMVIKLLQDPDRGVREESWMLSGRRQLEDREKLDALWSKMFVLREQLSKNAGLGNYRDYRWRELLRFDYTPENNMRFHQAVKSVLVPAYDRLLHKRRAKLGLPTLKPWDLRVDALARPPLRPFGEITDLNAGCSRIFHNVDAELGSQFDAMVAEGLLDLDSRKNKAPGGYCTSFAAAGKPFIFMNASGTHGDVQTLLHEAGHAFHAFATNHLPYHEQRSVPIEFAEVASMSMELLASRYLSRENGGFYTESEAARARIEALERIIQLWVSLGQADEFQHWVYTNPDESSDPASRDRYWLQLSREYTPSALDWSGLEDNRADGWRRILHIFVVPFYIIEYGLAQLAAIQLWSQALDDQEAAVRRYREALALGGTKSLPELYEAVGAPFDFGERTLGPAVQLIESTIEVLMPIADAS